MRGFLIVVARLAPAVTADQAQSELSIITRRIEEESPSDSRDWDVEVLPLLDATVKDVRPTLLVLFGVVDRVALVPNLAWQDFPAALRNAGSRRSGS